MTVPPHRDPVLRAMIDEMSEPVVVRDGTSGVLVDLNAAAEALFQLSRDQFLALPPDWDPCDCRDHAREVCWCTAAPGQALSEPVSHQLRADGSTVPVRPAVTHIVLDGRPLRIASLRRVGTPASEAYAATLGNLLDRALVEAQALQAIGAAAGEEPERVLSVALTELQRVMAVQGGALALVEEGVPMLRAASGSLAGGHDLDRARQVIKTRMPLLSVEVAARRSSVALPLFCQGAVVGVLELDCAGPALLSAADLGLLQRAATALSGPVDLVQRQEAEQRLHRIVDTAPDLISMIDLDGRYLFANAAYQTVLGYNPADLIGLHAFTGLRQEDERAIAAVLERARTIAAPAGAPLVARFTFPAPHAAGHWVELESRARLLYEAGDLPTGVLTVARDITEQRQVEASLQASEAYFRALTQHSSDMIVVLDGDGVLRYVSPSAERVVGYRPEQITGMDAFSFVEPDDLERVQEAFREKIEQPEQPVVPFEFRVRHADGEPRTLEVVTANLLDDPSVAGIVVNARDVTERKQLEEELAQQAFYDPLTSLPGRVLFVERLTHALATLPAGRVAVLFVDLDHFTAINDSLGHAAADELLVTAARRLEACIGEADTLARFTADEFTVLLEDVEGAGGAARVAERILAQLELMLPVAGREVFISASIGIVLNTGSTRRADDLLRAAEIAMFRAKRNGRGGFVIFDAAMNMETLARLEMETDLRLAVTRGELVLHYQPEVDLATSATTGMEALVRWPHPRRGLVQPEEFVELAEEVGLIHPLGRWVLREACRQAQDWQRFAPSDAPLVMSVNLSPRQLQQPDLATQVEQILTETGLPAAALRLEITETAAMRDAERTARTLDALKALGVRIAIDDFGTGYSSLGYLRRFPVDTLKVDQSFVRVLDRDQSARAIVQAVTGLAAAMGMEVTAEGIETAAQLEHLRALHAHRGQGFLFSPPLSREEMEARLAQ